MKHSSSGNSMYQGPVRKHNAFRKLGNPLWWKAEVRDTVAGLVKDFVLSREPI